MIVSFRCEETRNIFEGRTSGRFAAIHRAAFRKLMMLHAAESLRDLAGSGNSLEALKYDRAGQHAIRVSSKYRLCFVWKNGGAHDAEIVDYH